ncbi:hypothetical protein [Nonomuraea dietziae]|uniref:hypothetical protein n=1 Tax=Nonomuraea dietziae TaxID=65515 RepID=UPI0031DEF334
MIRVLVAEDVRMLREALVALLGFEEDIEVVGRSGHGRRDRARRRWSTGPTSRCSTSSLPALGRAERRCSAARAAARMPRADPHRAGQARQPTARGVEAHVSGFMLKDSRPQDLVQAMPHGRGPAVWSSTSSSPTRRSTSWQPADRARGRGPAPDG